MNLLNAKFLGYGVLLGTAGIKILTSDDAKKVYTHVTAAVLRGCDEVAKVATELKENCEDIYEDATDINEKRYAEEEARKLAEAKATVAAYEEAAAEEAKED